MKALGSGPLALRLPVSGGGVSSLSSPSSLASPLAVALAFGQAVEDHQPALAEEGHGVADGAQRP